MDSDDILIPNRYCRIAFDAIDGYGHTREIHITVPFREPVRQGDLASATSERLSAIFGLLIADAVARLDAADAADAAEPAEARAAVERADLDEDEPRWSLGEAVEEPGPVIQSEIRAALAGLEPATRIAFLRVLLEEAEAEGRAQFEALRQLLHVELAALDTPPDLSPEPEPKPRRAREPRDPNAGERVLELMVGGPLPAREIEQRIGLKNVHQTLQHLKQAGKIRRFPGRLWGLRTAGVGSGDQI